MYQWIVALKDPGNKLWVVPGTWAIVTVIYVFALRLATIMLPEGILPDISQDTLESLLNVIASSMLAVSTFSLSIMVSAFLSASDSTTPRATKLVMDDGSARMAITSFICAFIYSIIAQTALGLKFYGQNGRFVLFVSTVIVLAYLIITLIRWVHTLTQIGRLGNTLSKIEKVAGASLQQYRLAPQMHATRERKLSAEAKPVRADSSGYLTHIDMKTLQKQAEEHDCVIHINLRPGELITPASVLCLVDGQIEDVSILQKSFIINKERTFEQDPCWGFIVLSEAAQRALSSAVNDPGTAINVMSRMMSLLIEGVKKEDRASEGDKDEINYDRLSIEKLDCAELIRDGFAPISRDGEGILEINLVLQKVLAGIWRDVPEREIADAAFDMAKHALERAKQALSYEPEVILLVQKHDSLFK